MSTAVASPPPILSERIRVRGTVQGVGFRPFVWRLAHAAGLAGTVCNDGEGVLIELHGPADAIGKLVSDLRRNAPPLARIDAIEREALASRHPPAGFSIIASADTAITTRPPADAATCDACVAEIFDPDDRRYGYPFANCTHCGPRLSIIEAIPYDRANTTMRDFHLCPRCAAEYGDPADRRFHAQPNACPDCGPKLWLEAGDLRVEGNEAALDAAVARLLRGEVVAIKGIGGIHLAVDATDRKALEKLRRRKHRPTKPLALMARDVAQIRRWCRVSRAEAAMLRSAAAPVVLLPRRDEATADECLIAPRRRQLGFMLPYSPLHHLLMARLDRPIVLTSGNLSSEPQCIDNDDARDRLAGIADALLLHDRDIANRIDDSVAREMAGEMRLLRRARGFAPQSLKLPKGFSGAPDLLAMGGELKNTFCLLQQGSAVLSQHMGDLENVATFDDYRKNLRLYEKLFAHDPCAIVIDRHPDYLSARLGREMARTRRLPLIEVQHHHAHVAACLAENGRPLNAAPVLGIVLDGLGFGDDGELWGGELLLTDYREYHRVGSLKSVPLPGAALAMREPWRNLWAQLDAAGIAEDDWPDALRRKPVRTLRKMRAQGLNSPLASSCGRLFDAVAAAVGVCFDRISHEGEAAIGLEALIGNRDDRGYEFHIGHNGQRLLLDPAPMWRALLDDLRHGVSRGEISARFHDGLAAALADAAMRLKREIDFDTVVLSGGVFQNRTLLESLLRRLEKRCTVLLHRDVPMNDGGIALGQAAVAAARLLHGEPQVTRGTHSTT